jgi:hypothetical protein
MPARAEPDAAAIQRDHRQIEDALRAVRAEIATSWVERGARLETDAAAGVQRVMSPDGETLATFPTPAAETRRQQAQQTGARFEQRWRPKSSRLHREPKLLTQYLDDAEALPEGAPHPRLVGPSS